MTIQNAIFDLDGTLIDSMPAWRNYQMDVMERLSGVIFTEEERKIYIQYPYDDMMRMACEAHAMTVDRAAVSDECEALMKERYANGTLEVKPYVYDYLGYLKKNGCGVALATATPKALCVPFLRLKGLYDFFDCIVTTVDDVHIGKRESAAVYDAALAALGGTKENTAVFEDVLICMQTCRKNGYYTIAVPDVCQTATIDQIRLTANRCINSYKEMMI